MKKSISLGERLKLAAGFVREGAVLADVGTDHGYLPIYLLSSGKIKTAVCSDINSGPLGKAEENVRHSGLLGKVIFKLCSGAQGLSGLGVTDYTVCGMGGELIAEILEASPHLKDESLNFVLQPMTKPEALRSYLWSNGFEIIREGYCLDEGKYYLCINARYTGRVKKYTPFEAYFGEKLHLIGSADEALVGYVKAKMSALRSVIRGKTLGGVECDAERTLYKELCQKFDLPSDGEVL